MLGTGTELDPYQITSRLELEAIVNDYTAHYKLMNDIDLSDSNWTPLPLKHPVTNAIFSGTIDGNGKRILNMTVTIESGTIRAGFFEAISGATVKKLGFENINLTTNYMYASPLPYANNCIIEECYATGTVTLNGTATYGGGLCGYITNGSKVSNCWTDVHITTESGQLCGGFSGYIFQNTTQVSNCFAFGTITDKTDAWDGVGGFYGQLPTNTSYHPKFLYCYFDSTKLGNTNHTTNQVFAWTTEQLQTASNFTDNFSSDIWLLKDSQYPKLQAFEEKVVVVIEERNIVSHINNLNSGVMIDKIATQKIVSSFNELSAQAQKIIRATKTNTTFVKDIVSGVVRQMQVVKVGAETVTSYILPITSNIESLVKRVKLMTATVISDVGTFNSEVVREIQSLRQALSFIDVIVGKVITPTLKPVEIEAIVYHMENGTLSEYLSNQYSMSVLENRTLVEVRE
ncbi:hypothetical protein MTP04_34460 [Lysinibacillus sp. PLM2]|nr:hypothetical protein MTP04_34460 [Lysinibacillus sp. PLM2]